MTEGIIKKISSKRGLSLMSYLIAKMMPNFKKNKKYRNALLASYCINKGLFKTGNGPVNVRISPISICNYRCLFCEIHKDNLLYPNRPMNVFTLQDLKNYEYFLSSAFNIDFYGGSAEPLLNSNFSDIVSYLKRNYNPKLMVNTNASVMTKKLSDTFVKCGFDKILVSYHAGTKECYNYLTTCGNIDIVDRNLKYLDERKKLFKKGKPEIEFNFALQRLNSGEFKTIIDKAKEFGVNKILVSKYYGGRNKLQGKKVSFDYCPEDGNKILDEIYDYAKKKDVKFIPEKPNYWIKESSKIKWEPCNFNFSKKCFSPWLSLHFDPVLDEENCHYISVCNRIPLFKVNYRKLNLLDKKIFDKIWNHPILQYMRKTINLKEPNPICKYCKNCQRERLRNVDAEKYAEVRDKSVESFFSEFRKNYQYDEIEGLEVLEENPHSDEKFKNILGNKK